MNSITFRKYKKGGEVNKTDHFKNRDDRNKFYATRDYLILLVHGYDVGEDDAERIYSDFAQALCNLSRVISLDNIWGIHWPGDDKWGLINKVLYPSKIPKAVKSGELLADLLNQYLQYLSFQENLSVNIIIIGHSLGCRLILEALKNLANNQISDTKSIKICLMAAAVPFQLTLPPRLRQDNLNENLRLWSGVELASNRLVLFSEIDEALGLAFNSGQWAAGESYGEAVGLRGKPNPENENERVWSKRENMGIYKYKHSHYWRDKNTDQANTRVAGMIIDQIGAIRISTTDR